MKTVSVLFTFIFLASTLNFDVEAFMGFSIFSPSPTPDPTPDPVPSPVPSPVPATPSPDPSPVPATFIWLTESELTTAFAAMHINNLSLFHKTSEGTDYGKRILLSSEPTAFEFFLEIDNYSSNRCGQKYSEIQAARLKKSHNSRKSKKSKKSTDECIPPEYDYAAYDEKCLNFLITWDLILHVRGKPACTQLYPYVNDNVELSFITDAEKYYYMRILSMDRIVIPTPIPDLVEGKPTWWKSVKQHMDATFEQIIPFPFYIHDKYGGPSDPSDPGFDPKNPGFDLNRFNAALLAKSEVFTNGKDRLIERFIGDEIGASKKIISCEVSNETCPCGSIAIPDCFPFKAQFVFDRILNVDELNEEDFLYWQYPIPLTSARAGADTTSWPGDFFALMW